MVPYPTVRPVRRMIRRALVNRRLGRRNAQPQGFELATPAFGSMDPIRQTRRQCLSRVRAIRSGSSDVTANAPALEPVQHRADGLAGRPAVKMVAGFGRESRKRR
jgi:hypothetical protein